MIFTDHTPHPFAHLGVKDDRYATLSKGLFDEMHEKKPFEQYQRTIFDTKKMKISKFVQMDALDDNYNFDPVVFAWNIDPLTKQYPYYSPYLCAGNNPIRYIDIEGMGPGDPFKTVDEAAKDFGKTYNDNSIGAKKEYATTIIKVVTKTDVYYTYVQPSVGNEASSSPSTRGLARLDENTEDVAAAHTHGNYSTSYDNENFSPADKSYAESYKYPIYVATPEGSLKKYDPTSKSTTTVATDMPSDPIDPTRVNTIDPVPLPKNEPTYNAWDWIKHNVLIPVGAGASAIQNKAPNPQPAPSNNECSDECR